MKANWRSSFCFLGLVLVAGWGARARAQGSLPVKSDGQAAPRDASHDFDFAFGTWKTEVKRLVHPLSGSTAWAEYQGTTVVRKIWDGRANLAELEVSGPEGHIEGLSLRLYNPQARQWSLNFASARDGSLGQPTIGGFREGRGEFYDQETFGGRAILVRFVISDIRPDSVHFEQSFSDDGGKSWEVNWIATDTRMKDDAVAAKSGQPGQAPADKDGQAGFAFELGSWTIHLKRRENPLTGSTKWVEFDGTSVTRKVWDGRAQIEEFRVGSPGGQIEGTTLRLYNREARQWNIYWATSQGGVLGLPTVGEFKDGRGEFYDQEPYRGRAILVRYVWSETATSSPHFEQAFSADGGKTWEVNWITDQTRATASSGAAN